MSDGVNLPFVDRLDWRAFTVQITERDMVHASVERKSTCTHTHTR